MRRALGVLVSAVALSGCSLFGNGTPATTTTTTTVATTTTSTTTTTTTLPSRARIDDLPDIDENSPASLIRVAQRLATARGFRAEIDGDFGRQTRARVNALRAFLGLEPTGAIDTEVWRAVFEESTLPFGPVDAEVIQGVEAMASLRVPEIAFLLDADEFEGEARAHYVIPFFVDGAMFAAWAEREATTALGERWTICAPTLGYGEDFVTLAGVSTEGAAFTYRVAGNGVGRVDVHIEVSSGAVGECP